MKTETKFKKGDVVKVPDDYLTSIAGPFYKDRFKMVRRVYKLRGVKTLELQGKLFTQDVPAEVCELWIKA